MPGLREHVLASGAVPVPGAGLPTDPSAPPASISAQPRPDFGMMHTLHSESHSISSYVLPMPYDYFPQAIYLQGNIERIEKSIQYLHTIVIVYVITV